MNCHRVTNECNIRTWNFNSVAHSCWMKGKKQDQSRMWFALTSFSFFQPLNSGYHMMHPLHSCVLGLDWLPKPTHIKMHSLKEGWFFFSVTHRTTNGVDHAGLKNFSWSREHFTPPDMLAVKTCQILGYLFLLLVLLITVQYTLDRSRDEYISCMWRVTMVTKIDWIADLIVGRDELRYVTLCLCEVHTSV